MKFYKDFAKGVLLMSLKGELESDTLKEIKANSEEAAVEKHIPFVEIKDNKIKAVVGEVIHPMVEDHFIEFIVAEFESSFEVKYLKPGMAPEAVFSVKKEEKLLNVYAYCNKHGMWVKKI